MGKLLAIDFGHTYASMGYINEKGEYRLIENLEGELKTPMVVFFENDNVVAVGSTARAEGFFEPEALVSHCKQHLGNSFTYTVKGRKISAKTAACCMLKKMLMDAEYHLEEDVDGIVFGYPTYWGETERLEMEQAINDLSRADGCKIGALGSYCEPLAAALGYASLGQQAMKKRLLVCDLGGATFDCTVVALDYQNDLSYTAEVQAKGGNRSLGGEAWDSILTDLMIEKFCAETGSDEKAMRSDLETVSWLNENIEKAKKVLTYKEVTALAHLFEEQKVRVTVTREEFLTATQHLTLQMINCVRTMILNAGLSMEQDIDEILLVGGASRMPQIAVALKNAFQKPVAEKETEHLILKGLLAYSRKAEIQGALERVQMHFQQVKEWREREWKQVADWKAQEQAKLEAELGNYRKQANMERARLEAELRTLREQMKEQQKSVCGDLYLVDDIPCEEGILLNSIGCMVKIDGLDAYCEMLKSGSLIPEEGVLQVKRQFAVVGGGDAECVTLSVVTQEESGYRNIGQVIWRRQDNLSDDRFRVRFSLSRKGCLEVELENLGSCKKTMACFENFPQIKIAHEELKHPFILL